MAARGGAMRIHHSPQNLTLVHFLIRTPSARCSTGREWQAQGGVKEEG
jgi:hypothetical protein